MLVTACAVSKPRQSWFFACRGRCGGTAAQERRARRARSHKRFLLGSTSLNSDSWLFSNPDFIECGIQVGEHHLYANAVGSERPNTYKLIGACWWYRVWNRVRHEPLSHCARLDVCPTHNKLVV